jgi:hypothetical protein
MLRFGRSSVNNGASIKEQWGSVENNLKNKRLVEKLTNMMKNKSVLTGKNIEELNPILLGDIPVILYPNKAVIQLNSLKEVVPCLIMAKEDDRTAPKTVTAIKKSLSKLASDLVTALKSRSNIISDDMDTLLSELLNGLNNYGINVVTVDSRVLDSRNTLMNHFYNKVPVETGQKNIENE